MAAVPVCISSGPCSKVGEQLIQLEQMCNKNTSASAKKLGFSPAIIIPENEEFNNKSSYVLCIKVVYDFAQALLLSPVSLVMDKEKNVYVVQKCHAVQRLGCLFIQLLSSLSAMHMLMGMGRTLLKHTGYIVSYFDFMNGVFLHFYFYSLVYLHWFRMDILQNFVFSLQTNPCVKFCNWSARKAKGLAIFFWCLTLYMCFIWQISIFQLELPTVVTVSNFTMRSSLTFPFHLDFTPTVRSIEGMAKAIFWLDEDFSVSNDKSYTSNCTLDWCFSVGVCILAILGRLYNSIFFHMAHNVFGPCFMFTVYFVTRDFIAAVEAPDLIDIYKVMPLYRSFLQFIKHSNGLVSRFAIHFVGITLTYHCIHLFDALNVQNGTLWKINTYLYLIYLFNFLVLPTKTWMLGQKMKQWLRKNDNMSLIQRQELLLLLFDLKTGQVAFKGGKFFVITARFSGMIFQNLLGYSMLNTVAREVYSKKFH